jgi:4-amino-4-deoxy-L-arabinose transferase-like glycosyltransferase
VLTGWLLLAAVLAVCAVPMLVAVGRSDSKRTMENIALLSAQETWLRQHGWQDIPADPDAWLMPTRNGNPRIVKPPLVIWLDMLAWTGLTPQTSSAEQLIFRARLVSVGMGLLTVAGVFWIGCVLGDHKLAVMSALAAGTCLFLQRQARIASYDMHMTGWATLAVASAFWAMRPFGPAPGLGRAAFGWCLAGVALAGAFMSKGPLALLVGAAPVLCTMIVVKERWRRHAWGLSGMLLITAVLTAPWYLYVNSVVANAGGVLLHEYQAERVEFQPPYYYLGLLGLVLPWSVWLVGGLAHPFMRSSGEARRRLMVSWAWFVLIFVAFSLPGAKQQRYILPIVPAAALLIGQLWRYHESLAQRGETDPGVNLLRVPHWSAVMVVSLLAWPFFVSQGWMVQRGWFDTMPVGDVPMIYAASAGVVLTVLAVLGARWHFEWKPMRAALATAAWSAVLMTLVWYAWSTGGRGVHPVRAPAEQVARDTDGAVIGCLKHRRYTLAPNEEFLLYARRILKPVRPRQVIEFGQSAPRVYLIAPQQREVIRLLKRSGYKKVRKFQHDYDEILGLWKYVGDPGAEPADEAGGQEPAAMRPDP